MKHLGQGIYEYTHEEYLAQLDLENMEKKRAEQATQYRYDKAELEGTSSNTGLGERLIKHAYQEAKENIQNLLDSYNKPKRGAVPKYIKALERIRQVYKENPQDLLHLLVYIPMANGINVIYNDRSNLTYIVTLTMASILDEVNIEAFIKEQAKKKEIPYNQIQKEVDTHMKQRKSDAYRHSYITYRYRQEGYNKISFTTEEKKALGIEIIKRTLIETGYFEIRAEEYHKGQTINKLRPTEWLIKTWTQNINNIIHFSFTTPPCIIPPQKWTTPYNGGYYGHLAGKQSLIRSHYQQDNIFLTQYRKRLSTLELTNIYNAVNSLQNTAYKMPTNISNAVGTARQFTPQAKESYQGSYSGVTPTRFTVNTNREEQLASNIQLLSNALLNYRLKHEEYLDKKGLEQAEQMVQGMTEDDLRKMDTISYAQENGFVDATANPYFRAYADKLRGNFLASRMKQEFDEYMQTQQPKTIEEQYEMWNKFSNKYKEQFLSENQPENMYAFDKGYEENNLVSAIQITNKFLEAKRQDDLLMVTSSFDNKIGECIRNSVEYLKTNGTMTHEMQVAINEARLAGIPLNQILQVLGKGLKEFITSGRMNNTRLLQMCDNLQIDTATDGTPIMLSTLINTQDMAELQIEYDNTLAPINLRLYMEDIIQKGDEGLTELENHISDLQQNNPDEVKKYLKIYPQVKSRIETDKRQQQLLDTKSTKEQMKAEAKYKEQLNQKESLTSLAEILKVDNTLNAFRGIEISKFKDIDSDIRLQVYQEMQSRLIKEAQNDPDKAFSQLQRLSTHKVFKDIVYQASQGSFITANTNLKNEATTQANLAKQYAQSASDNLEESKGYAQLVKEAETNTTQAMERVIESETKATESATKAAKSETASYTSSLNASQSATQAEESASNADANAVKAEAYAKQAERSAGISATSSDEAEAYAKQAKQYANSASQGQLQADYNETDTTSKSYIKNIPRYVVVSTRTRGEDEPTYDITPAELLISDGTIATDTDNLVVNIEGTNYKTNDQYTIERKD